jgi:DNA replication protein DnaC
MEAQVTTPNAEPNQPVVGTSESLREKCIAYLYQFGRVPREVSNRRTDDALMECCKALEAKRNAEREEKFQARQQEDRRKWADDWLKERGPRYAGATIESFQFSKDRTYRAAQKAVVAAVQDYANHLEDRVATGIGLWFRGNVGTGKDHLAIALGYLAACRGIWPLYASGFELFAGARGAMHEGNELEIVDRYAHNKVLILSDPVPASGTLTPYQQSILLAVADERNQRMHPTWVTTNILTSAEADERLGAQIVDRLMQDAVVLDCCWPSWRTERAS